MGIVNVIKGLNTHKETHRFNGSLRENLDLNWEYTKIFKGSEELTPDYGLYPINCTSLSNVS